MTTSLKSSTAAEATTSTDHFGSGCSGSDRSPNCLQICLSKNKHLPVMNFANRGGRGQAKLT